MNLNRIVFFFTSVLGFYFLIDLIKITAAKQLQSKLTPLAIHKIKLVTSIVLVVFGLVLGLQGIFPGGKDQVLEYLIQFNS